MNFLNKTSLMSDRGRHADDSFNQRKEMPQNTNIFDVTIPLTNYERRLYDHTNISNNISMSDLSQVSTTAITNKKTEKLFLNFLDILQSRNNSEIFDTIQDLIQAITDNLHESNNIRSINKKIPSTELWLKNERNTWRLLFCLYKDRLITQTANVDYDDLSLSSTEETIVEHLYLTNANLREYQLIVDWLEECALESNAVQCSQFTDRTFAWENTFHQLIVSEKDKEKIAFSSTRSIVESLDPDAPHREKKSLHDLDIDDEARLSKQILLNIRQGLIEEAQLLCEYFGQTWRAAILEGWRLHHDPNYEINDCNKKMPIKGNSRRDIWKKCAWMMADNKNLDIYNKAIAGAFCGHLESLLSCLNETWSDLLWSYLKVQIDIRVENELRSSSMKNYVSMPDEYWNNKISLEQIFDEIQTKNNIDNSLIETIQKYIILDNVQELMLKIDVILKEKKLSAHILRFLTHLILFLRQIKKLACNDTIGDKIIKAYVECLIEIGEPQLVAYYTAALAQDMQIGLYSQFCETIGETSLRKQCLEDGMAVGLDINAITTYTVESICNRQNFNGIDEQPLKTTITDLDLLKISSLEWLTFYPNQLVDLLWQGNCLVRTFLAENKIECVRKVFYLIPYNTIQTIVAIYDNKDNLPVKENCSIKEYLCHQTYLRALDAYNDWINYFSNKPKEPHLLSVAANFTEKMASDHKEKMYKNEIERWNNNLTEQTKLTKDILFNILLFPEKGWLVDPVSKNDSVDDPDQDMEEFNTEIWLNRSIQLQKLRELCIPEIVLLLHKILHMAGNYKDCVELSDTLADEQFKLYEVYSKHKLSEILIKISESSIMLMNQKLDPWGYSLNN